MLISLTRDLFAQIDEEDADLVCPFRWWASPVKSSMSAFYGYTQISGRTIYMHRLIAGAKKSDVVDHADFNGLNNRRSNLRLTDLRGNGANKRIPLPSSGFRGVYRHGRRFVAQVYKNGAAQRVGFFDTAEAAAQARDHAALKAYGPMAVLNHREHP